MASTMPKMRLNQMAQEVAVPMVSRVTRLAASASSASVPAEMPFHSRRGRIKNHRNVYPANSGQQRRRSLRSRDRLKKDLVSSIVRTS